MEIVGLGLVYSVHVFILPKMAAKGFHFDRHFFQMYKHNQVACCECQTVSKFTKQGIMQHGNSCHKGVKDLKERSIAYTKEMVITETRDLLTTFSDHKKV